MYDFNRLLVVIPEALETYRCSNKFWKQQVSLKFSDLSLFCESFVSERNDVTVWGQTDRGRFGIDARRSLFILKVTHSTRNEVGQLIISYISPVLGLPLRPTRTCWRQRRHLACLPQSGRTARRTNTSAACAATDSSSSGRRSWWSCEGRRLAESSLLKSTFSWTGCLH